MKVLLTMLILLTIVFILFTVVVIACAIINKKKNKEIFINNEDINLNKITYILFKDHELNDEEKDLINFIKNVSDVKNINDNLLELVNQVDKYLSNEFFNSYEQAKEMYLTLEDIIESFGSDIVNNIHYLSNLDCSLDELNDELLLYKINIYHTLNEVMKKRQELLVSKALDLEINTKIN